MATPTTPEDEDGDVCHDSNSSMEVDASPTNGIARHRPSPLTFSPEMEGMVEEELSARATHRGGFGRDGALR